MENDFKIEITYIIAKWYFNLFETHKKLAMIY